MSALNNLNVLLVEDEEEILKSMNSALDGFFKKIITAKNGDEGLKKFKKYNPDIVITDILMPIMDGLAMSKAIKNISKNTVIIVLSAYSEKEKLLTAINVHIDKYLIKPIDMDELLAAINELAHDKIGISSVIEIGGGYTFDKTRRVMIRDGEEIALTKKELAFIAVLIKKLGVLVLHNEIKESVWSNEHVSDAAVRTFVKRLRDKVGANLIKNVSGLGYKIETNL